MDEQHRLLGPIILKHELRVSLPGLILTVFKKAFCWWILQCLSLPACHIGNDVQSFWRELPLSISSSICLFLWARSSCLLMVTMTLLTDYSIWPPLHFLLWMRSSWEVSHWSGVQIRSRRKWMKNVINTSWHFWRKPGSGATNVLGVPWFLWFYQSNPSPSVT